MGRDAGWYNLDQKGPSDTTHQRPTSPQRSVYHLTCPRAKGGMRGHSQEKRAGDQSEHLSTGTHYAQAGPSMRCTSAIGKRSVLANRLGTKSKIHCQVHRVPSERWCRPRMAHDSPRAIPGPWLVSVNKGLLAHDHARRFPCHPWWLSCYESRAEELQQSLFGLQSQKYLLSGFAGKACCLLV